MPDWILKILAFLSLTTGTLMFAVFLAFWIVPLVVVLVVGIVSLGTH